VILNHDFKSNDFKSFATLVTCLDAPLLQFRSGTSLSHGCVTQQSSVAPAKKSGLLYSLSLPPRRSRFYLCTLLSYIANAIHLYNTCCVLKVPFWVLTSTMSDWVTTTGESRPKAHCQLSLFSSELRAGN